MNNDEAKFILSAYRAGGHDAGDPQFREALKQAEIDPQLREWLKQERVFDAAMIDGLRHVRPPEDLRAQIIAGARVSHSNKWRWPMRLAMAAIVILAATLVFVQVESNNPKTVAVSDWQKMALDFLSNNPQLDLLSPKPAKLAAYLRSHGSPTLAELPKMLTTLSAIGCKDLESNGRRISIMCFNGEDGKTLHLVVTDIEGGLNLHASEPMIAEHNGWAMATWPEGTRRVMLMTRGTAEELRRYL